MSFACPIYSLLQASAPRHFDARRISFHVVQACCGFQRYLDLGTVSLSLQPTAKLILIVCQLLDYQLEDDFGVGGILGPTHAPT